MSLRPTNPVPADDRPFFSASQAAKASSPSREEIIEAFKNWLITLPEAEKERPILSSDGTSYSPQMLLHAIEVDGQFGQLLVKALQRFYDFSNQE